VVACKVVRIVGTM